MTAAGLRPQVRYVSSVLVTYLVIEDRLERKRIEWEVSASEIRWERTDCGCGGAPAEAAAAAAEAVAVAGAEDGDGAAAAEYVAAAVDVAVVENG